MVIAAEIQKRVQQWLDGKISFRELEDWFVPVAGRIANENDAEAERLVDDIDMSLSEYSDGVLSVSELRAELANAIRPFAPLERMLQPKRATRDIGDPWLRTRSSSHSLAVSALVS